MFETANYGNVYYEKYRQWSLTAPRPMDYAPWLEMMLAARDAEIANLKAAQHSVQRTACKLGDDPVHVGPFVSTPEGKAKCMSCGEQW